MCDKKKDEMCKMDKVKMITKSLVLVRQIWKSVPDPVVEIIFEIQFLVFNLVITGMATSSSYGAVILINKNTNDSAHHSFVPSSCT
jgi:hypothetical protein